MANKRKSEAIEPIEAVEEVAVEEEVVEVKDHEDFVSRKLKAINSMEKPAKAQRLANRLLRKARN